MIFWALIAFDCMHMSANLQAAQFNFHTSFLFPNTNKLTWILWLIFDHSNSFTWIVFVKVSAHLPNFICDHLSLF